MPASERKKRLPFPDLVEEVRRILDDPVERKRQIADVAEELGTSAQRIADALDTVEMLGLTEKIPVA